MSLKRNLVRLGLNGVTGSQFISAVSNASLPIIALRFEGELSSVAHISIALVLYSVVLGISRSILVEPYLVSAPQNQHLGRITAYVSPAMIASYILICIFLQYTLQLNILYQFVLFLPLYVIYDISRYALIFEDKYSRIFFGEITTVLAFLGSLFFVSSLANFNVDSLFFLWSFSYIPGILHNFLIIKTQTAKTMLVKLPRRRFFYHFFDWFFLTGGNLLICMVVLAIVSPVENISYRIAVSCTGFAPLIAYSHLIYISRHADRIANWKVSSLTKKAILPFITMGSLFCILVLVPNSIYFDILKFNSDFFKSLLFLVCLLHLSNLLNLTLRFWHQDSNLFKANWILNLIYLLIIITCLILTKNDFSILVFLKSQLVASLFLTFSSLISVKLNSILAKRDHP